MIARQPTRKAKAEVSKSFVVVKEFLTDVKRGLRVLQKSETGNNRH